MPRTDLKHFLSRCDTSLGPDGCWIWTGHVSRRYGVVSMNDRPVRAHRAAWILHYGAIPDGMAVCHACDTPLCCNPSHLFLGTVNDNNQDKVLKGRQTFGESVTHSILKSSDVAEIKRLLSQGVRGVRLAERFGVARCTISAIKAGRIWNSRSAANALGM